MDFKPANKIQDLQYFGEFGGVNPSISDSSTYTFLSAKKMFETLWDSINAKRGYGWGANPWVWVVSFKQIKKG